MKLFHLAKFAAALGIVSLPAPAARQAQNYVGQHMQEIAVGTHFTPVFPNSLTGNLLYYDPNGNLMPWSPGAVTGFVTPTNPGAYYFNGNAYYTEVVQPSSGGTFTSRVYPNPGDAILVEPDHYYDGTVGVQFGYPQGMGTIAVFNYPSLSLAVLSYANTMVLPGPGEYVWYYTPAHVTSVNPNSPTINAYLQTHHLGVPFYVTPY